MNELINQSLLFHCLFSQQSKAASNQKPVVTTGHTAEEPVGGSSGGGQVKPHLLIRRKSNLMGDMDTAMALKQYNTVDQVLQPSKEA